jgi:hypothetical protein
LTENHKKVDTVSACGYIAPMSSDTQSITIRLDLTQYKKISAEAMKTERSMNYVIAKIIKAHYAGAK